jgi:hypothetical protein
MEKTKKMFEDDLKDVNVDDLGEEKEHGIVGIDETPVAEDGEEVEEVQKDNPVSKVIEKQPTKEIESNEEQESEKEEEEEEEEVATSDEDDTEEYVASTNADEEEEEEEVEEEVEEVEETEEEPEDEPDEESDSESEQLEPDEDFEDCDETENLHKKAVKIVVNNSDIPKGGRKAHLDAIVPKKLENVDEMNATKKAVRKASTSPTSSSVHGKTKVVTAVKKTKPKLTSVPDTITKKSIPPKVVKKVKKMTPSSEAHIVTVKKVKKLDTKKAPEVVVHLSKASMNPKKKAVLDSPDDDTVMADSTMKIYEDGKKNGQKRQREDNDDKPTKRRKKSEDDEEGGGKKKRKKREKEEGEPIRARNAYMFFSQDRRKYAKEHPDDQRYAQKKMTELTKEFAVEWKAATPEVRAPYEKLAKDDAARFHKERDEWMSKKGMKKVEETNESAVAAKSEITKSKDSINSAATRLLAAVNAGLSDQPMNTV